MNTKLIARYALLLLVLGSVGYLGLREWRGGTNAAAPTTESLANADGTMPRMIVYYLSIGKDCTTCENLERYTRESLDTHFVEELAQGMIGWRSYDMDQPEHAHFATDFELYTKSIVLAAVSDGELVQWKNLTQVWEHVYDKERFIAYIRDEIQQFLEGIV